MIDFGPGPEQETLAEALTTLVERGGEQDAPDASPALWTALAEVGLLGLCTEAVGGRAVDLVAAMEALGAARCPGPLVGAVAASQLLHTDALDALSDGRRRATLTDGRFVPWASPATLVIQVVHGTAWEVEPVGEWTARPTLSGEPWSVGRCRRVAVLGDATSAIVLANLALSAYVLGAARYLVARGAEHAQSRVQFGRPIGQFQAVAHPLAYALAEISAGRDLAYLAAAEVEAGATGTGRSWCLRAAATRASVAAAMAVHQAMGAMGFAVETGIGAVSTRIRQWSLLPLGAAPADSPSPNDPEPRGA